MDQERQSDEQMPFSVIGSGKGAFAEFTTSEDILVTVGNEAILDVLRAKADKIARVKLKAWYDFGRLQSYKIISFEGRQPRQ